MSGVVVKPLKAAIYRGAKCQRGGVLGVVSLPKFENYCKKLKIYIWTNISLQLIKDNAQCIWLIIPSNSMFQVAN